MKMKTFDKAKGKSVMAGSIRNGKYYRTVTNAHYMVKHQGYGIQSNVFSELYAKGVHTIVLQAKGVNLIAPLYVWVDNGVVKDYGHGDQVFLSTKFMREVKK